MAAYLFLDPFVLGVVSWLSAIVTLVGFSIAIFQIRRVATATEAAQAATMEAIKVAHNREQMAELSLATMHSSNAINSIARGSYDVATVHAGLFKSALIKIKALQSNSGAAEANYDKVIGRVGKLIVEVENSVGNPIEENKIKILTELRALNEIVEKDSVRLRYILPEQGE